MSAKTLEYTSPVIHIGLVVADLQRSLNFYQDILGMTKVNQYDISADFAVRSGLANKQAFQIEVLKLQDSPSATEWKLMSFANKPQAKQQSPHQQNGMQYATLLVSDLKPFITRFKANKIAMLGETPIAINEQLSFVLIQDPDGNFLEIIGSSN